MDVDQRKKVMGEQVIKRVLDERPSHRAPATRFRGSWKTTCPKTTPIGRCAL